MGLGGLPGTGPPWDSTSPPAGACWVRPSSRFRKNRACHRPAGARGPTCSPCHRPFAARPRWDISPTARPIDSMRRTHLESPKRTGRRRVFQEKKPVRHSAKAYITSWAYRGKGDRRHSNGRSAPLSDAESNSIQFHDPEFSSWCSVGRGQDDPLHQSENCSFILPLRLRTMIPA